MIQFNRSDIKYALGTTTYQRGLGYFNQGRAETLDVEKSSAAELIFHSLVQGRGSSPYKQSIYIRQRDLGSPDIEGFCSCPMRYNCKHVVAACLQYLSESAMQAMNGMSGNINTSLSWLNDFVQAGTHADSPDTHGINFIFYILKPAEPELTKHSAELSVSVITSRYLKKGGVGKGRRINIHDMTFDYSCPAGTQDSDKEIATLIEAQNESRWGGTRDYTLSGELGFLALSKMLDSGRCYCYDTSGTALHFAEPRKLQLHWQKENNGDHRLEISVTPEARPLNTLPVLYLDTEAGTIGMVSDADFTAKQWAMLMTLPVVPAATTVKFSQQLLTLLPGIALPPPQEIETITITQQTPVPYLFLSSEINPASKERRHFIRLRFAYAGYELALMPELPLRNLITENQVVQIQRDLAAEKDAINKLFSAGFQAFTDETSGDIYFIGSDENNPMVSAGHWQQFLHDILPTLEAEGWQVVFDDAFHLQFLQADSWEAAIEADDETSVNNWFDLRFDLDIQGRKLPLLPLIAQVLNDYDPDNLPEMLTLPMGDSQYLQLPAERIRPIYQILYELYDSSTLAGTKSNPFDSDGNMRLNRFDATRLAELEENCSSELHWRGGKAMRTLGRKLKNFRGIKAVATPRGLKAELRDYQQQGLNWLQFLRSYMFNGILADDMGLGKTVQTLAHMALEKERRRMKKPCLIVAPTSLMGNWRRESERFTPRLKVLTLQGPDRKQWFAAINQYDLILTTYPLLVRDQEILLAEEYYYLILDESQVIKNPRAKAARLAREVKAEHRLCLTGTPMENHLGELWALFDFLMPGFLGESKLFNQRFRHPIEKQANTEQRQRLVRRISPFMLRRSKSEVAKELPGKTEIIRSIALDSKQASLYESIRLSMEKKVRDAIAQKGLARSHITILDALLKLRQTCCDPQLLSLTQAKKVKTSAKLEMLMQMLPEMLEEGRRILVFSQFTKMLSIIERRLIDSDITYTKLTGQTSKRDEVIERFRRGDADVFLISLKAGGVGLNLTEADTVIHYDPWWNPAVENQATDRAHRIGQNKAVFVYKLITENTLEEKIMAMQARKQALAEGVYNNDKQGQNLKLNAEDLQALFAPLAG